jgi:ATP-dependent helicase/nuclease subunit A
MLHEERPVIEVDKESRPVEAGDILILVRSRSPLFRQIIAALKAHDLPIAGVDRSALTAPTGRAGPAVAAAVSGHARG